MNEGQAVSITNGMIVNDAVTSSKIADGAVGASDLSGNAVTSSKIQDGTIQQSDLSFSVPDGHSLDAADGDPVDAVYVDASGNVGIGTTSPQGRLDVNGTIYQRGSELHADYVFEPGYKLESIREHSEFIWNNKHLKAIPKAKVDENGQEIVEVGAHQKGIVEELEKAHIYIEQLHNRLETLEAELVALRELKDKLAKLEGGLNTGK